MALTVTTIKRNVTGAFKQVIADVTFDSSYPTGGESFGPADVDPSAASGSAFWFLAAHNNDATLADQRECAYDYTNKKLVLRTAITTEATNASDQSNVTIRVLGVYGGGI